MEEIFLMFDDDNSGLLDEDEFMAMLPKLGLNMSEAKANKYFRLCDADGSGAIDLEEFKVAMFALDPETGNTVGFTPNDILSPQDAFHMFDEDNSGTLDEDEIADVVEYMQMDVSDAKQERLFKRFDLDGGGFIEYPEFKRMAFVLQRKRNYASADMRWKNTQARWSCVGASSNSSMKKKKKEEHAIAEAKQWRLANRKGKRKEAGDAALKRANDELACALDIAGQVYIFGIGAYGQFRSEPIPPANGILRYRAEHMA